MAVLDAVRWGNLGSGPVHVYAFSVWLAGTAFI